MRSVALLTFALLGCKDGTRPAATTSSGSATLSATGSGSAPAPSTASIPEAEARDYADKLAAAAVTCSPATIAPLLDDGALVGPLCAWMSGISSYHQIRVRTVDGESRPLMRRLRGDDAGMHVNYDLLRLTRDNGNVVLRDVYSYRQGKWLTATLPGAPSSPDMDKARDLIRAGKDDEAYALIEKLPPATRRDLLMRAYVMSDLGPTEAKQALAQLAKDFPDDPAIALTEVDGAYDNKDYDAMLHWLDVLEKEIGTDAFLSSQRAVAYLEKRDLPHALDAANAAVTQEPTLTHAHQVKLDVLIEMKAWPEVLAEMTELEAHHGQHFDEALLRAEPRLAELVKSPAFASWLANRQH